MAAHSDHVRDLVQGFSRGLRSHYSCMRNDLFAQRLAAELDAALEAVAKAR
jgi:hypothetical protein